MKKSASIKDNISAASLIIIILAIWHFVTTRGIVGPYLLPKPFDVIKAFVTDFSTIASHLGTTLIEAFLGLFVGVSLGFVAALLMDLSEFVYSALYPILVLTQTVPTVAIAPLLVLWMGYGIAPKIALIVIVTFFPVAISLLEAFKQVDQDKIKLLKAMGASRFEIYKYIKLPESMGNFFSALKIAVSYSVVGAVIAEWLGGFKGLGVYMIRVQKNYSFDKMFAVIFLISAISLILMKLVSYIQKKMMPWMEEE
ncbi:ABC transporter permease [Peptoniphilus sp. AGMB00490]|uniref:ABC transporter permease n=1 Tax=Peptoniphilus faecalis TaxID=2731255 RepID=A0A848R9T2_9FIRM|nr:ABC transporter permease [Peptoniphilus faecalis]NMW86087.1 ABC transporter permease [Peptoniphilus faecalis]